MRRLRPYLPTITGAALLVVVADLFIAFYRVIGLARDAAIYAGLFTFVSFATFLAQRWFKPSASNHASTGDTHDA